MRSDDLFPAYAALWRRLPAEALWVHYYGGSARGESGYFQHDGQGCFKRPEIGILRPFHIDEDEPSMARSDGHLVDLKAEMCTLAHEYGHYLSWADEASRETWRSYQRAAVLRDQLLDAMTGAHCFNVLTHRDRLRRRLPGQAKRLIVAEETRAWELGRDLIPEGLRAEYDDDAVHGVHCHRYRLGIDPLWPGDDDTQPESVEDIANSQAFGGSASRTRSRRPRR